MGDTLFVAIVFFLGLFLGSFLNVVVYRLWVREQFLTGRSYCPHCRKQIASRDLIPVISFLLLRGKCRYCQKNISIQYPLVEAATGVNLALAAAVLGFGWHFVLAACVALFLIVIFVFDLLHKLILDVVSYPFLVLAFAAGLVFGHSLGSVLLGAAIGGGVFLLQILLSHGRWVGGGDLKFGIGMGLLLGWEHVLLALFLAYISGAFISGFLLLTRRATAKSAIPFGTFLTFGTYVALLWGEPILLFYDHLI